MLEKIYRSFQKINVGANNYVDVDKIVRHAADIDNFNISVPRVRNVGGMLLNRQANSLKSADAHIKIRAIDTSKSWAGAVEKYASMMKCK